MLDFLPELLKGAITTVEITLLASALAICLAFAAGLGRLSRRVLVRGFCVTYIEFFRGTALLVQLFWLFFVLPQFGILLEPLTVAVMGIGLNYGAYGAEVVRGSILGVPKGQFDAAIALNLSPFRTLWKIVLPQAAVIMIPPWGNLLIQLLKATSLVSLITITEITFRAYQLNQLTVRTGEIFGTVLVIYFCLSQLIAIGTRKLEHLVSRGRALGKPS
jgi:polar amino acid transport system permease protein